MKVPIPVGITVYIYLLSDLGARTSTMSCFVMSHVALVIIVHVVSPLLSERICPVSIFSAIMDVACLCDSKHLTVTYFCRPAEVGFIEVMKGLFQFSLLGF